MNKTVFMYGWIRCSYEEAYRKGFDLKSIWPNWIRNGGLAMKKGLMVTIEMRDMGVDYSDRKR